MTAPLPLVYVEWVDSATVHGWHSLDELQRDCTSVLMQSVGWIVKETDDTLMLSAHLHKETDEHDAVRMAADATAIPKVAITMRRVLRKR